MSRTYSTFPVKSRIYVNGKEQAFGKDDWPHGKENT